jgi:hypothetical protein
MVCALMNNGVISAKPPNDTATAIRTASKPAFFSIFSQCLYFNKFMAGYACAGKGAGTCCGVGS